MKLSLMAGGIMVCLSVAFANYTVFIPLMVLWLIAGFGQTLAEMPSQILIAGNIPKKDHGKVYGAHFAWSHLWWAFAYPIAGFTGTHFPNTEFLMGAGLALALFVLIILFYYPFNN
jgi:NRE family putative nickel resistance protein-like MFS transporter